MYWVEVKFTNGKTLRKECKSINESYAVVNRYNTAYKKPSVQQIRAGRDEVETLSISLIENIYH